MLVFLCNLNCDRMDDVKLLPEQKLIIEISHHFPGERIVYRDAGIDVHRNDDHANTIRWIVDLQKDPAALSLIRPRGKITGIDRRMHVSYQGRLRGMEGEPLGMITP